MFSNFNEELVQLPQILEEIKKYSDQYLNTISERPTSALPALKDTELPETGIGSLEALGVFDDNFGDTLVSSIGPRYWGFVTGGVTPAALAADWLTSVFDQNPQSVTGNGDISAKIEMEALAMLRSLLELPDTFNGGFVSGATMSNFTGLATARQWAGQQLGRDIARKGIGNEVVVMGAAPHSSVIKSLAMLGIGSDSLLKIKQIEGREAIDMDDLEQQLTAYKHVPVILTCSAGTVNTVDFDDIDKIVQLKSKYNFWLHIDAAFGGFAVCTDEFKYLLKGWEQADSITIDCHKWLNVPYDSAVIYTRKEHAHLQVQTFQNSNAAYLGDPNENFSFLNFVPENSRRLRALPVWFSLVAYGRTGFKSIFENSIASARAFASGISSSDDFELLAPLRLNVVCFALKNGDNTLFLEKLNKAGKVFMTPTVVFGKPGIRAAFVNYRTTDEDVRIALLELEKTVKLL